MTSGFLRKSLVSGSVGALTSTLALAVVARLEGRGAAQPLNATSHWLNGDRAARRRRVDLQHTGVGLATHGAATVFWAAFFEAWQSTRPARGPGAALDVVGRAGAVAVLAAVVDYTITPRRFTPGWELVLSKGAMAAAYAAMASGFAVTRL